MKSTRLRFLIAALVVVIGTALANAQTSADAPPMRGHGLEFGMGGHMGFFARELNLTDDQKAQMKDIMEKEHPTMKPLFQKERKIDRQLRAYVEGTYDPVKVRALANQKAKLEVELTVQQTRIHNEMYQLLTSDQQAKVKELEANREARMQQHMQNEPPPPPSE